MRSPSDRSPHRNPFVFVVGCPRSGTTLLQRMLDSHPWLAVSNDTHFIPRALKHLLPDAHNPPLTEDLVERVRTYKRFYRLGLTDEAVARAARGADTYRAFVCALYDAFAAKHDKLLGGEKTPDYVRHLPFLHALFPWARFVHIIRDGRDVALSTLEWAREDKGPGRLPLWREDPVATCALWWRRMVETGRRDGLDLGSTRYYELRYEDLVADPEAKLRDVAAFLDLPFSTDMLAFHVGKTRRAHGLSAKAAWLPPTPGLRDWRAQMSAPDRALFEALAGDLLKALGYAPGVAVIPPETAALAERRRQAWIRQKRSRHALPRAATLPT